MRRVHALAALFGFVVPVATNSPRYCVGWPGGHRQVVSVPPRSVSHFDERRAAAGACCHWMLIKIPRVVVAEQAACVIFTFSYLEISRSVTILRESYHVLRHLRDRSDDRDHGTGATGHVGAGLLTSLPTPATRPRAMTRRLEGCT